MPHEQSTLIMWLGLALGDLAGTHVREMVLSALATHTGAGDTDTDSDEAVENDDDDGLKARSPSPPPEAAASRLFMHPLSLVFDDHECEVEFLLATWHAGPLALGQRVRLVMGGAALGCALAYQTAWSAVPLLYAAGLLVHAQSRGGAAVPSEPPAHQVFVAGHLQRSQRELVWQLLCGASAYAASRWRSEACAAPSALGICFLGAYAALAVVHQWLVSMAPPHRATSRVAVIVGVVLAHVDWAGAQLGPSVLEHVGLCACLLAFGELIGYSLEHVRRTSFIQRRAWDEEAAKSEMRARRAEAQARNLEQQKGRQRAQRAADSRLNHVIKGRCGTARTAILSFLELHPMLSGQALAADLQDMLERTVEGLGEAVEWCHRRQIFVQLEEGTYTSHKTACNVRALLAAAVGQDGTAEVADSAAEVALDESVIRIVLEEALSNARKYRAPRTPITICAHFEEAAAAAAEAEATGATGGAAGAGAGAAGGARATEATMLHVQVRNANSEGARLLTAEQLSRVMEAGYKTRHASAMSDGVGLDSVRQAAHGAGGRAWLSMDAQHTTLHAMLPAGPVSPAAAAPTTHGLGELRRAVDPVSLPDTPGRATDASSSMGGSPPRGGSPWMRGVEPGLRSGESVLSRASTVMSEGGSSSGTWLATSKAGRASAELPARGQPVCLGLETDPLERRLLRVLFEIQLNADSRYGGVLSGTAAEEAAFADIALGRTAVPNGDAATLDGGGAEGSLPTRACAADLVVLARTPNLESGQTGAELADNLRARGYRGLICILTAASPLSLVQCKALSAADLILQRGGGLDAMAGRIREALHAKRQNAFPVRNGRTLRGAPEQALGWEQETRVRREKRCQLSGPPPTRAASLLMPAHRQEASTTQPDQRVASVASMAPPPVAGTLPDGGGRGLEQQPGVGEDPPLVCLGIDDEDMPRMVQELFFRMTLNADMERSFVLGVTVEEQLAFVDVALGRRDPQSLVRSREANADDKSTSSASSTPDAPHISTFVEADVALLDENINLDMTPEPLTGSVLAGRLAAEGFRGVTCILTGASLDEMDSLRQKPGVDLVFAKGSPLSAIAESIRRLHRTKCVLSHAA